MKIQKRKIAICASISLIGLANINSVNAQDNQENKQSEYTAIMPTVEVSSTKETSSTKGYIGYQEAEISKNQLPVKEIPQTIDVIDIQKNKNYGTNDLSSILEGNAGIDASYDMRGESIFIRGFSADGSDIYRDGVRESGQVRRSTANIERVEILKGPASVLYGRSSGGGIINMVSRFADFQTRRTISASYGSYANRSGTFDINQKINENIAVRLTGEISKSNSFRSNIYSKGEMISPSITMKLGKAVWTAQYTYDKAFRIPDRGPSKTQYDLMGISYNQGFSRRGDYVTDNLSVFRSDLYYSINDTWDVKWQLAHRKASQDFDHYYGGTFNPQTKLLSQSYAWQKTDNKTLSSSLTFNGKINTGDIKHHLTIGLDIAREERHPIIATLRNQNINPYGEPASWGRISPLPAKTIDNLHKAPSLGLFLQDTISLNDKLKIVASGRMDKFKFTSTNIRNQTSTYNGSTFSPSIGMVWEVNNQHTAYASWNKSFAPYGGNGNLGIDASANPEVFNTKPENSEQFEIGVKSDWLDKRLSTTISIFNLERKNIRYRPDVNDLTRWEIRGKDSSRGIELSAIGQVYKNLYIRSSLGIMSAKTVEDKQNPINIGRPLANTSKLMGNLFVRYAPNPWFIEGGITHLGKRYYYTNNIQESIPKFTRFDALAGYSKDNWTMTLGIANVFNKKYWRSNSMPATPRAVMAKVHYSF